MYSAGKPENAKHETCLVCCAMHVLISRNSSKETYRIFEKKGRLLDCRKGVNLHADPSDMHSQLTGAAGA